MIRLVCVAVCLILSSSAAAWSAPIISVDNDSLASGTVINNLIPGLTFSLVGDTGDVDVRSWSGASTPGNVFGNTADGTEWGNGFNGGLRIDFANPTSFVSIDIIANDGFDSGRLLAYDALGVLIGTYTTGGLGYTQRETASITRPTSDIAYVIATGSANGADSVALDNLLYAASEVPEPASLAVWGLVSLAGVGAGWYRKRNRAKSA